MSWIGMPSGMPVLPREQVDPADETAVALAAVGIAAGIVHLALVVAHLREATALGILFALAGAAEIAWGVAVLRWPRSRTVLLGGALLLGAILTAWLESRTFGLPLGSERWQPEPFGVLDGITSVAELVACGLALRRVAGSSGRVRGHYPEATTSLALLLAVVAVLVLVSGAVHAH